MTWFLLLGLVFALGLSLLSVATRRAELARMRGSVRAREVAVRHGADRARLQHPVVDLSRCLGCGTCVAACPEDGVLELVHGQAVVVRGARCQGISACERECPVGAITVTLANLHERDDVPCVNEGLEALGTPGLFLAGEVTAHALIKTAIEQGSAVAEEVAHKLRAGEGRAPHADGEPLDLCIVGAGPAGLACALEAQRQGLSYALVDQEAAPGGTVAKYPRRKLVLTQPVELPLHGRLRRSTYEKEELVALWEGIVHEHALAFFPGEVLTAADPDPRGGFVVTTARGAERIERRARCVCLALGRRGTPRRLGVPGEQLPKVSYALIDASSYVGRRILVVGGGDSAVEAAVALSEQAGNAVTLSYRKEAFVRLRAKTAALLRAAVGAGRLQVRTQSEVVAIGPDTVELALVDGARIERCTLPNDEVFVLIGGSAPLELLERSGVSFDPRLREAPEPPSEAGTGLLRALQVGFVLALAALGWVLWNHDYYGLERGARPAHAKHLFLRPGLGFGLWMGFGSLVLIGLNLLYLLRRSAGRAFRLGSLQSWMTAHVATGILAFLCALVHSALAPRNTPGGHAFWALAVLLVTGAIGRYFYAWVPRAANGHELALAEVKARLGRLSEEWGKGQRRFRERVRAELAALIERRQWTGSFLGRVRALLLGQRELRVLLARLGDEARADGVDAAQVGETKKLAREAYRTALMAAHYEDLRAILNTWRYLHRWVAALMVLLVVLHVFMALAFGAHLFGGGVR